MRSRSLVKFLAVPVAAVGIAAAAALSAPAAHADTINIDQSGTVALTLPLSYIAQLAEAGVVSFPVPLSELSTDGQNVTVTFSVTGGEADAGVFFGAADLSGSLEVASISGHLVNLGSLQLDVQNGDIAATPAGSSTAVPLLDLGSVTATSTPDPANPALDFADTYAATSVTVDPAGAAYLDGALRTKAFVAGQSTGGSLNASWSVAYPS